jgi:hypothetical protein
MMRLHFIDRLNKQPVPKVKSPNLSQLIPNTLEFAEKDDTEKYAEMIFDVAESILGIFKLSKTQLDSKTN